MFTLSMAYKLSFMYFVEKLIQARKYSNVGHFNHFVGFNVKRNYVYIF